MKINIACLQIVSHPFDWDYNIEKVKVMVTEAKNNGAQICLFPELFIPGYAYSNNIYKHAEDLNDKTILFLKELAKRLGVYISGTIFEKTEEDFYNTMFFIGPNGLIGIYHKINVFSLENKYFKKGKKGIILNTEFGSIGLAICADMKYAKLWKYYSGKVDLILISSAWAEAPEGSKSSYWTHELALCKELPIKISNIFKVPLAYCNACHSYKGNIPLIKELNFAGFSKIVDKGNIIASLNNRKEGIIQGFIELNKEKLDINKGEFKNWIRYALNEKLIKFMLEKVVTFFAKYIYIKNKKKNLNSE